MTGPHFEVAFLARAHRSNGRGTLYPRSICQKKRKFHRAAERNERSIDYLMVRAVLWAQSPRRGSVSRHRLVWTGADGPGRADASVSIERADRALLLVVDDLPSDAEPSSCGMLEHLPGRHAVVRLRIEPLPATATDACLLGQYSCPYEVEDGGGVFKLAQALTRAIVQRMIPGACSTPTCAQ
jgi:hypothetical protein